jgi:carboxylate-amine ligase
MRTFRDQFQFDATKAFYVGVERERFLTVKGHIAPIAPMVLDALKEMGEKFGYELSACQLEDRIGPHRLEDVAAALYDNDECIADASCITCGFGTFHSEVGPENMPLDVYPDPTGRYQEITRNMPRHILLAACRVIGTHIHIGMPDHETALRVYNSVVPHYMELCEKGNGSFGERLAIYRIMAPDYEPKPYRDWEHFSEVAVAKGFAEDPRRCWTLIRISKHGTIEFRMFGATSSLLRIVGWVRLCHTLCREAAI